MKFIRRIILNIRLAAIFKQAEQLVERGVKPGDERYLELLVRADGLTLLFHERYPDFNRNEIPALKDLEKLTEAEPSNVMWAVPLGFGLLVASAVAIGTYAGIISVVFHTVVHHFGG